MFRKLSFGVLLLLFLSLWSRNVSGGICGILGGFQVSLYPQVYHLDRSREGGTSQAGCFGGLEGKLEQIGNCPYYIGLRGIWGKGTLRGCTGQNGKVYSDMTQTEWEGRLGYAFFINKPLCFRMIPFAGYGRYWQVNKFRNPSPVPLHFRTSYQFVSVGILTTLDWGSCWNIGINARVEYVLDAHCRVSKDPQYENSTLTVGEEFQYEIELPVVYRTCLHCYETELSCAPFYFYRHFGGREDYPFDFLDTKLKSYGAKLGFTIKF